MITYEIAREIAANYLRNQSIDLDDPLVVIEEKTFEIWFGWIFSYNTESAVFGRSLGVSGNLPFLVSKANGQVSNLTKVQKVIVLIVWLLRCTRSKIKHVLK
jgi:hypothetical protein